jgi:hypothetical protein
MLAWHYDSNLYDSSCFVQRPAVTISNIFAVKKSNLHDSHFRENWFGNRMRTCDLFSFIGWNLLDSPYKLKWNW